MSVLATPEDSQLNKRTPVNLFRQLREASGLSHEQLAREMSTTKQALIRLEQGLFENPLPVAMNYWLTKAQSVPSQLPPGFRITHLTLLDSYVNYQEDIRDQNRHYFGRDLSMCSYARGAPHPFVQLKALAQTHQNLTAPISTVGVAKALCIPQSTLSLWERKPQVQKSVPKCFQVALLSTGYVRQQVRTFNLGYEHWREENK